MCGIVGFVGNTNAAPILLNNLEKLEYRGYDSAGISVIENGCIVTKKAKGRIANLKKITDDGKNVNGCLGIGHTRWATHGEPNDINSHPHESMHGKFAVVHNGIIENYVSIRESLTKKGFKFMSETDTETVTQLLESYYDGNIMDAIVKTLHMIDGSYALGIICNDCTDKFYAVKKDNPLIIGLGDGENYIASDVTALIEHTRKVCYLEDNEIAVISKDSVHIYNLNGEEVEVKVKEIDWNINAAEKGGYPHFMMKEIMEQPKVIRDTVTPRIKNGEVVLDGIELDRYLDTVNKIVITACGSAYHAGFVGKYVLEKLARVPVEVDLASEFRYRDPMINKNSLVIAVSQSGETADTLAALKEAKRRGAKTIAIVNVVSSAIATTADDVIYTWAGPEIAVATTKAYSAQLTVFYLLAIYMARRLGKIDDARNAQLIADLINLPEKVEKLFEQKTVIQNMASLYFNEKHIFFIGRNLDYASALEGSLKLKEISYIHSEAYAAGELKHGTISLIEEGRLVVAVACQNQLFEKTLSNIREVKARGADIVAIVDESNTVIESETDKVLYIPSTDPLFTASLSVIPMQFFGYYVAAANGCDIDKPRNLAKSVTVE
ncbi:MAG: glutamine--fructose-6-phosphate transaminase (isomerizing) [Clostridia bacterium]|nr:glutamine--fructose-6-phosphate transaminase (isomerizing) [Clostridia bacterium]MBQ2319287.1 glutamine--fructose-6-phosphate transaminase (isomerizing) [Clostridia bacterium]MBQ2420697.1 glutamine--fructose-6-phosphate transaminase (isomerizing) [Clostridia bacterium]